MGLLGEGKISDLRDNIVGPDSRGTPFGLPLDRPTEISTPAMDQTKVPWGLPFTRLQEYS